MANPSQLSEKYGSPQFPAPCTGLPSDGIS